MRSVRFPFFGDAERAGSPFSYRSTFLDKEGLEDRTWEEALRPSKIVIESVTLNQWLNMWAKLCDM